MYSSGEYFTTLDFKTINKDLWKQTFGLEKHHNMRKEVGITYCGYSSNRKDTDDMAVCFKFNNEETMKQHRENLDKLLEENREKWSALGDLDSIEFNHWKILCERVNDMRFEDVLNKSDDVFWFARHSVGNKETWVKTLRQQQDNGQNYDVRWWGLMESTSDENEVACVYRVPRDRLQDFVLGFVETIPIFKQIATIDVETLMVRFLNLEWETMYSMPESMHRHMERTPENDEKTIQNIITDITDRWIENKELATTHLDESFILIRPSGNPLDLAGWNSMMNSDDVVNEYSKLLGIQKIDVQGDMAYATYTSHARFSYKGTPNNDIATFTIVLKCVNSVWKVVLMQRSTGQEPGDIEEAVSV